MQSDADATVVSLDANTPPGFRSLVEADDNVLLFLDEAGRLMVGNASWSFTLSRKH